MKSNHFPARGFVSFLLSFLLSLFVGVFCLLIIVQATVMNAGYLKKQVEKSDFTHYRMEEIEDSFVSYGLASGFEEEFILTVLKEETIHRDILAQADALYGKADHSFNEKQYADALYQKLIQNVRDRDIIVDEEAETTVYHLAEECAKIYAGHIEFPVADQISQVLRVLKTPLWVALGVDVVFLLITLFLLFRLYKRKYKFISFVIYSLSGTFLLLGVPSLAVILSGRIARLGITNQALYHLLQSYAGGVLSIILSVAFGLLALTILLYIIYYVKRKQFIRSLHGEYHK